MPLRPLRLLPVLALSVAALHCGAPSSDPNASSNEEVSSSASAGPIHPEASAGLCLDVVGQGTVNGTQVQVWSCSGNANQQWAYDGTSLRVYGDKCLDVTSGSTTDGTKLQIWDCIAGNTNQRWTRTGETFQWAGNGKCLDLTSGAATSGTLVQSWTCYAGTTNQEWSLGAASSGGGGRGSGSGSGSGRGSGSGGTTTPPPPAASVDYAPYFPTWVWGGSGYAFTSLADLQKKSGLDEVTIAFVLSNGGCDTTQDIEQNLDDVKAFEAAGGHVKASFGGADGAYVESKCGSASALASAYEAFVDATGITDLDFDVEQDPMETDAVNAMRGQALKIVQGSRGVKVAFTLPANPSPGGGLTGEGLSVVRSAIEAGVTVSHVNFMTMDYGDSFGGQPLAPVVEGTLYDGHKQIHEPRPRDLLGGGVADARSHPDDREERRLRGLLARRRELSRLVRDDEPRGARLVLVDRPRPAGERLQLREHGRVHGLRVQCDLRGGVPLRAPAREARPSCAGRERSTLGAVWEAR